LGPVTRESIPRFDLYAELEVSRLASVEVIDAAYRTLAKRHHPDVARGYDADRIKRLNLAHDWLTDPVRRRRYDNATRSEHPPASSPKAPTIPPDGIDPRGRTGSGKEFGKAFGINTAEVRQFLADLRSLDDGRAAEVRAGKAATDATAYAAAQHVAFTSGRAQRQAAWLLAREAASVIAKGKLHESPLGAEVSGVVADIAGAIAIRDLIPATDFDVLLQPWTWLPDQVAAPAPILAAQPSSARVTVAPGVTFGVTFGRTGRSLLSSPPAVMAIVAVIALVGTALALTPPKRESAVAGFTDAPTATAPPVLSGAASPSVTGAAASPAPAASDVIAGPSVAPTPFAAASAAPGPTPRATLLPSPTPPPTLTPTLTPAPTTVPTAAPTPVPTPVPTPPPTPAPTPVPTPTLAPTPSPPVFCPVVSLITVNTSNAQLTWSTAGFTGTVLFVTPIPPHYKIAWQSLVVGDIVPCTSDITVAQTAP
jgi:hypothetical protein